MSDFFIIICQLIEEKMSGKYLALLSVESGFVFWEKVYYK